MERDILKAIVELQTNMESRFDGINKRLKNHDDQFTGIRTQLKEQFTRIDTQLKEQSTGIHTQLDRMENERQAEIMSMLKHISQKQDENNQNNDYLLHKNQEHDKEIYRLKKHIQN